MELKLQEVNPLKLINPLSPYADLFVNIYNATKPSSEWMRNYIPHTLDEDNNKIGCNLLSKSPSPGDVKAKLEDERGHGEIYCGPLQLGLKWVKENGLVTIKEQLDMDQSPVRVSWLRGLICEYFLQ